jgi:transposase
MSRYRLRPSAAQEAVLLGHCAHARYVWNLCVEQESHWRPGRGKMPGFAGRCRQLSAARAAEPWLAAGSVIVQQQAIRDHDQAMRSYYAGTHRRPSWRKAGRDEGFRIVHLKPHDVRRLNRNTGEVRIPKAGWVRFRWSRQVPQDAKSLRVTYDRAGRWHVAFAVVPEPEPGRNVRAKAGLNRGILGSGWGLLVRRLEDKAPGRVEKVRPAYTSQRCSACGHIAAGSRESQALFRCVACGYACNADVNAARNIAAGHAVTARGGFRAAGPANREPQPVLLPA